MTEIDRNTRRRMLDAFKVRFHDNEKSEGYDDRLMAALEAAIAVRDAALETDDAAPSTLPIAGEGKVKALEWRESWGGTYDDFPEWRADTPFGSVVASVAGYRDQNGNPYNKHRDIPADLKAKLISERETAYQTRILSALISSPGKDGGQEVEAVAYRWRLRENSPWGYSLFARDDAYVCEPLYARPQPASTALVDPKQVAREIAVAVVDLARGYTLEFSGNPAAHKDDYDRAEVEVLRLLEAKP